jgi:hypothetical protein
MDKIFMMLVLRFIIYILKKDSGVKHWNSHSPFNPIILSNDAEDELNCLKKEVI